MAGPRDGGEAGRGQLVKVPSVCHARKFRPDLGVHKDLPRVFGVCIFLVL